MKCPRGFSALQVVTGIFSRKCSEHFYRCISYTNVKERTKTTFIPQFSHSLCTFIRKDNTNQIKSGFKECPWPTHYTKSIMKRGLPICTLCLFSLDFYRKPIKKLFYHGHKQERKCAKLTTSTDIRRYWQTANHLF